jgi:hypothetical protein
MEESERGRGKGVSIPFRAWRWCDQGGGGGGGGGIVIFG